MRYIRALAVGALLITLAACGTATADPPADQAKSETTAVGAFPMTVEHAMGSTTISAKPVRVVALDQTFVDAVLTLDTELVGYTTYRAIDEKLPDYLKPVLDNATNAVSVGELADPSLEKIAALKPDLILSAKVRHEAIYDQLSKIAPTVFSETTGALWKDNLNLTAKVLDQKPLAEERLAAYEKRADALGASIKEANSGAMPTISIVRFAGEPTVRLYVENSYSGLVLKDVGFPRPADQPTTTETIIVEVSQENIPQLDAEHIFVSTWDDPSVAKTKEQVTSNKLWASLKGTKHDVHDLTWMSAVGLQGSHAILDDLAKFFSVDPAPAQR